MTEETKQEHQAFEEWAVLELLGHVRLAGKVSEANLFGTALGRIDIPKRDGGFVTQYFGGGSVYRITPVTEEIARAVAEHHEPEPVHRWELPAPKPVCPECGATFEKPACICGYHVADDDELPC